MKYTGPKVKLSRSLGVPLTPKAAKIMDRKAYPPGQHGREKQYRRGRLSAYKEQLTEKQRLRAQYNVHERQMRRYYSKAVQREGNTADNLVEQLETRLDSVILRSGLAVTIYAARQYVNHRHIMVNGKRVDIPSYTVKVGDVVSVRPKSQKLDMFTDALDRSASYTVPYLAVDPDSFSVTLKALPKRAEVPVVCEISKVIEFYSR